MFKHLGSKVSGKRVIALMVITNLVYVFMLVYSIPKLMEYSSGLPIFDMSPTGYSYDEALALLTALGNDGRQFYHTQLAIDLLYPALFAVCYFALFQWVMKWGNTRNQIWQWVSLLPIVAAAFDYAENMAIWLMLSEFPTLSHLLVTVSSALTMMKSGVTTVYWIALLVLIAIVSVQKYKKRSLRSLR
jgi:hypothetical protein